jgi:putative transposase
MSFDLQKILASKRALRRDLAARPIAEKLRLLDALRERQLAIRGKQTNRDAVGRVPSRGAAVPAVDESSPRRLRHLHRVWPDRHGNISYLLTICVDGRAHVLNNEETFQRLVVFLLDSPTRYRWFGRRFVVLPDHIHLIAHMGHEAVRLGQWIKAFKAVVGGLERRESPAPVGRVPPRGVTGKPREFTRAERVWRWQDGFHDHKFRTPESESRKWEYICLNPVRSGFVKRPEEWPFGGEIFYDDAGGTRLVRGTPPLLETGMLLEEETPREGTRPTT